MTQQEQYEEKKKLLAFIRERQDAYNDLAARYDIALSGLGEISKHTNEESISNIVRRTIDKLKSLS